ANALGAERRFGDAVRHFKEAITLRPDYPAAEFGLAGALAKEDRHEQAIEHYRKALAGRPNWVAALCGHGLSPYLDAQDEEAHGCCGRALASDPSFAEVQHGIGEALPDLGRLEESRRAAAKAVGLSPGVPGYLRSLAETKRFGADDPQLAAME